MYRKFLMGIAFASLSTITISASANLVQNGDFEGGTYDNSVIPDNPNYVPVDWTTNSAFSEDPFADGAHGMPYTGNSDLQIGPGGSPPGSENPTSISQTVTTSPGASYTVDFYLYTTQGTNISTPDASFEAQINGVDGFAIDGIPAGPYRSYTEVSFPFTGTGSDTLTFAVTDPESEQTLWEIDDVSINAVPEPSLLALLAWPVVFSRRWRRKTGML